jgi:hypothetical protein
MMSEATLRRIVESYLQPGGGPSPEIIVAGGGEPLIHRQASEFLDYLVRQGFQTSLTTNASRVTPELADRLVSLGLHCIYVSFWGIRRQEYEQAMHLSFESTLSKVEQLAARARKTKTPVRVKWLRTPEIQSTDEEIASFWERRQIPTLDGYHDIWNRGGLVRQRVSGELPDPARRIWCADLYFAETFNWAGDSLLCCCNYFTRRQILVGSIWTDTPRQLAERKREILEQRPIPPMCQVCRLPRSSRAKRLGRFVLDHLSPADRAMLVDYPEPGEDG